MSVKATPDGYHSLTPYLMTEGTVDFIVFLAATFGAVEMFRMEHPGGGIRHAEMRIGDSMLMLSEAHAAHPANPGMFYLYVKDVDATYHKALAAGADSLREPRDEFYGDRSAGVKDTWGNTWWIATHIEDVAPEEVKRRETVLRQAKTG